MRSLKVKKKKYIDLRPTPNTDRAMSSLMFSNVKLNCIETPPPPAPLPAKERRSGIEVEEEEEKREEIFTRSLYQGAFYSACSKWPPSG